MGAMWEPFRSHFVVKHSFYEHVFVYYNIWLKGQVKLGPRLPRDCVATTTKNTWEASVRVKRVTLAVALSLITRGF